MSDAVSTAAEEQSSFELALAAALATQEGSGPEAVAAETITPDPAPEASTQAQPPAPAAVLDAPAAPSARELERIAALEAREAKLREREAELEARAKPELKSPMPVFDIDKFMADPVGFVLSVKPDLTPAEAAKVAEPIYMHALGDKAPPEYRQRQEVSKVQSTVKTELDTLRAEIQELREARAREAQEAELRAYQGELKAAAVAAANAPIVANLAKRNPDRAAELLVEVARQEARAAAQRGAEPTVLGAAEAVAKLEALLKAQREDLYGPDAPVAAQPQASQSLSPTITNRDASIQPPRAVVDPLDDKALRKAALEAAGLGHLPVWD